MGEQMHMPVYFESSPSTVKLYERFGFVRLKEKLSHKGSVLGLPIVSMDVPLMVKMPSVADGLTFEEWRDAGYPKFGSEAAKRLKSGGAGAAAEGEKGAVAAAVTKAVSEASSEALKAGASRKSWWKKLVK